MAQVIFASSCPGGSFLITPDDWSGGEDQTLLVQSDHDHTYIAAAMGWRDNDGDCTAFEWIHENQGESFAELDAYLPDPSHDQ